SCAPPPRATPPTRFPYPTLFRSRTRRPAPEPAWPAQEKRERRPAPVGGRGGGKSRFPDGRRAASGWESWRLARWSEQALADYSRSEEHTSELQSRENLVCRLLLE